MIFYTLFIAWKKPRFEKKHVSVYQEELQEEDDQGSISGTGGGGNNGNIGGDQTQRPSPNLLSLQSLSSSIEKDGAESSITFNLRDGNSDGNRGGQLYDDCVSAGRYSTITDK